MHARRWWDYQIFETGRSHHHGQVDPQQHQAFSAVVAAEVAVAEATVAEVAVAEAAVAEAAVYM